MDDQISLVVIDPLSTILADQAKEKEPIADGVYFGLDEDTYHADPALGSTDIKSLRTSGPDYWWNSKYNPHRPEREDKSFHVFGRAVHKIVLEGVEPFLATYQREDDGDDVLRTDADLAKWLVGQGVTKLPKSKGEKIALAIALSSGLENPPKIEDEIKRQAAEAGRIILKAEDYDRIIGAAAAIADNPDLATAFQNGAAEVSVFWTIDLDGVDGVGIRCKARFDYLKIGGIGDLKSIRNSRGIDFVEACRRAISDLRYDIQAAHYMNARAALRELVAAGKVFGDHDAAWLEKVAARESYGFQWVFYQAEGAPNVKSFTLSPENPIRTTFGQGDVDRALATFRHYMNQFGPVHPWRLASPVEELALEDLPAWFGRS